MNLDNPIQYKSEITPGLVNTNPTLSQVILPNTFEDTFKSLMDTPMPAIYHIPTLQLDHGINSVVTNESLGSKLDGVLVGLNAELKRKDPNYNNPLHGGRTVPIDEVMPYVKTSNDYGSNLTAAFGQGAKGATSGALLGMTTAAIASAPVGELGGAAPLGGAIIGGIAGGATGFISGLFGVSGKQGYKLGRDNQEYTAQLQSGVGNRLTGFANNLINRTFETSIGGTAALLSTPFGAIMGKDFHDWGSNPLSESLSEGVENSEYKAKLSKNYMNSGPFGKFFTGEGFQNELADMAGFTLGMIGGMKITSGLNVGGARLLNSVFEAPNVLKRGKLIGDFLPTVGKQASMLFNQGVKAERTGLAFAETTFSKGIVGGTKDLGKAVWNNGTQGAKEFFEGYGMKLNNAFKEGGVGLAGLSSFERTMLASYGEGRIEAANAYKDTYEQAIKEGRSISEASEIADKAANKTLLGNLAVLGITNQFGLNQLMNPRTNILSLGKWFTKDWAVDNTTKTLVKNILSNTTKQMGKGVVMEGFAEELGQFAISEGAKNYQLNTANPNNPVHTSFLHEIIDAYREGLTSDEGISNWFGGALFGSIMGGVGMEGGIAGQYLDRKAANKLEIPEALKTPIDKMTKAALFMSEHTAPFNGQLFQTYSQDEDGVLIPDPAGTIRKINDPGRVSQLAKALAHINQLSTDQSMVIASSLVDMTKGYTGEDKNLKVVFETLKDYIDTSDNGDNAKQSLETYLQTKDNNIRRQVLTAIGTLSQQQEGAEITDDNLRKMYTNLVKSNYVYDHVSNGVEQNLFAELDRLEESIANPNTEAAKKDGVEFFGKLYKSTEIEQAKTDISNFRDDLTRQVKLYKSLANRYNEPLTHIIINKGKDKYRIPITVNLKKVFRSAMIQGDIQDSLEAIASAIEDTKTALYELPSLKKMYMDPSKTSIDVDKLLDSEEFTDKDSLEYKRYMFLKGRDKENLAWLDKENKHFERITNKDNLIKEALNHEKTLNTLQETVVPKVPAPKPAPAAVTPVIDEGPLQTPESLQPQDDLKKKEADDLAAKEALRLTKEAELKAQSQEEKDKAAFQRKLAEKKAKEAALALLALQAKEDDSEDTMFNDNNFASATPLTEDTIFKTHSAGTDDNENETQHSAFHKYLDDYVNPNNNEHAIFPVALDSELGNKIKAKEMKWYNSIVGTYTNPKTGKTYSPFLMKGHEVLYVLTKQVGGQTHVIRENGETIPLKDVLFGNPNIEKSNENRKKSLTTFAYSEHKGSDMTIAASTITYLDGTTEKVSDLLDVTNKDSHWRLKQTINSKYDAELKSLKGVSTSVEVPGDLLYSKSSAPHPQAKGESIEDTHKRWIAWVKGEKSTTKNIPQEFSTKDVDGLTDDKIIEIVGTYLNSLNKMYLDSTHMMEETFLNTLKPITGVTPGISKQSKKTKNVTIGDDFSFKVATLSKDQRVGTGQTLKKGRVYAFKEGKYYNVRYRNYSDKELDTITSLVMKKMSTGELTPTEGRYLRHVINWYDLLSDSSAGQQNSIGIVNDSVVFAPAKDGLRRDVPIEQFREELAKLKHYINKNVASNELFTDLATGTVYQDGYSEYLKSANVLTMTVPLNANEPIQKNRQIVFQADYGANKYELTPEVKQDTADTAVSNFEEYEYPKEADPEFVEFIKEYLRLTNWEVNPPQGVVTEDFPEDGYTVTATFHQNRAITINKFEPIPVDTSSDTKTDVETSLVVNEEATETPTDPGVVGFDEETKKALAEAQQREDDDAPFRRNPLQTYEYVENVDEFNTWLQQVLPQFQVTVESAPIDGIAQGQLVKNVIRIWEGAEKGTGFHEAFEAVWANVLSPEQKKNLLTEFRSREGKFEYPFDGRILEYAQAPDLEAKEMLAEEFMDFMKSTKLTPSPQANSFFMRLKKAITDLINQIKAFFGSTTQAKATINDIYENIAKGEYFNHNINSFYPYAENRLIQRFTTPNVDFSDMQDALDIIHDKFIEKVLENKDNTNIYNLLDDADNAEGSLSDFIGKNITPIIDEFEIEMRDVAAHPDNRAVGKRTFHSSNTLFAPLDSDTILKSGLKEELKKLYIEQFLKRSKLKDFVDFQAMDEINTSSKEGRVSEDEINPTSNVNTVIRFLLGTLYHTDELGSKIPLADNTPWTKGNKLRRYVKPTPHAVQNILLNTLSNVDEHYNQDELKSTFNIMVDKLDSLLKVDKVKYGWVHDLKKKLNGPLTNKENKLKLKIAFENSFHNLKFNPLSLQYNNGRMMFVDPVLETNIKNTIQTWITNLKNLAQNNHRHLEIDTNNNVVFRNFIAYSTPAENYRFFKNLGLDFGAITAEKTEALEAVISVLMNNPTMGIRELFEKQANSRMYTLAKNAIVDSNESLQNYIKSTGKTAHTIINPNTIGRAINKINGIYDISDLMKSLPHLLNKTTGSLKYGLSNNVFLRKGGAIFNNNFTKHSGAGMTLCTLDGMSLGDTNEGMSFTSLPEVDKLKLKMNAVLHNTFSLLINSDKSTEFALKLNKQLVDYNTYCTEKGSDQYINAFLIPQLRDELEILFNKEKAFQVKIFKDNTDGKINLGRFTDILNLTQKEYDQLVKNKDADKFIAYVTPRLTEWVKEDYGKFFKVFREEKMMQDLDYEQACKIMSIPQLTEPIMGIDPRTGKMVQVGKELLPWETTFLTKLNGPSGKDGILYNSLVKFMYYNYEVFNNDIQQLLYGNINMYKKGDAQKRWNFITSSKQPSAVSADTLSEMDSIHARLDGKVRDGNYNVISYQDVEAVSSIINVIAENFYEIHKQRGTPHTDAEKLIGATFNEVTGKILKINDNTKGTLIGPYLKLESADAQAFMTGDGYFDLMYTSGKLNSNQVALIKWEQAYERVKRNALGETDPHHYKYAKRKAMFNLKDDKALIETEKPSAILQVIKPQGSGYNNDVDIVTPIFLKNSVLPLFWSRIEGNEHLKNIYVNAQKSKVDIIGFNSGQKMGNILNAQGQLTPLYNKDGSTNADTIPPVQQISMEDFGLQVETANVYKSESNRGVQVTKLVTSNLVDHMADPAVVGAVQVYFKNLNDMIALGTDDLYNKLGIEFDTENRGYVVKNVENLAKSLKEQGLGLDLPQNVMDLFEVVDGKLPYKFDASTERNRIEYILNALLDKALIHQKVKGTQAPQVSSIFERYSNDLMILKDGVYIKVDDYSKLTPEEQSKVRIGSNDLRLLPDGTIEVKMPSYLGDNVDISKVDPKLLELIGYRIPTQSLGQVEKIKVVGFLDKSYGDCIFVPAELVGKSGSDFDIDKLNIYLPHYYQDSKGEHQIINYDSDQSEDGVVRRYNAYVRRMLVREYAAQSKEFKAKLKAEKDELAIVYSSLPDKEDDIRFQSIAFYELPISIQQEYRENNQILNKAGLTGTEKTQEFRDYTVKFIELLKENGDTVRPAYNKNINGYFDQTINAKATIKIFEKLIAEYDAELVERGLDKDQVASFIEKRDAYRKLKADTNASLNSLGQVLGVNNPSIKTLDEFRHLSIGAQNTREALENRNIELMRNLISLPQNRLQHLAPNSAATLEAMDKTLNDQTEVKSYEISSLLGSTKMRHTLSAAKDLVGIGAVNVTGHALAQIGETSIGQIAEGVRYEELVTGDEYVLYKQYDNKHNLISSNISEYLSGFVDAAKDPFVVRLNINKHTLPQIMLLQRLGLSIEDTMRFVNQPIIKKYVRALERQTSIFKKAKGGVAGKVDIQNVLIVELLSGTPAFEGNSTHRGVIQDIADVFLREAYEPQTVQEGEETNYYEVREMLNAAKAFLEDYLTENEEVNYTKNIKAISDLKGPEFKYAQAIVLADFIAMNKPAQAVGNLNNAMNIDSKNTKTLVENNLLLDTSQEAFEMGNADDILRRTHLEQIMANRLGFGKYLSPFLQIAKDPFLKNIINNASKTVAKDFGSKNKDAVLNAFTNYVVTYIIQNSPSFDKNYNLFDPESGLSLANRIKHIKENPIYTDRGFKFFDNLSFSLNQLTKDVETDLSFNVMLYNSKADTVDRNIEIARYEEIMQKAETYIKWGQNRDLSGKPHIVEQLNFFRDVQDVLNTMVSYSVLQSGVDNVYSSLQPTLPAGLYCEAVDKYIKEFDTSKLSFDLLWKQFHQQKWSDAKIVKRTKHYLRANKDEVYAIPGETRKYINNFGAANIADTPTATETGDFEDLPVGSRLLQLVGQGENNTGLYQEITRIGNGKWGVVTLTEDTADMISEEELPFKKYVVAGEQPLSAFKGERPSLNSQVDEETNELIEPIVTTQETVEDDQLIPECKGGAPF